MDEQEKEIQQEELTRRDELYAVSEELIKCIKEKLFNIENLKNKELGMILHHFWAQLNNDIETSAGEIDAKSLIKL